MAPLRGWAPVEQRLHAKVLYGRWRTMTFPAALRCDRIDAPCVLDQPVNAQSFTDYVEQCVVPTLSPGDVVIMDMCGRPRWSKQNFKKRTARGSGADMCPALMRP